MTQWTYYFYDLKLHLGIQLKKKKKMTIEFIYQTSLPEAKSMSNMFPRHLILSESLLFRYVRWDSVGSPETNELKV